MWVLQVPVPRIKGTTRSPTTKSLTLLPTEITSPTPSLPGTDGKFGRTAYLPVIVIKSAGFTVFARQQTAFPTQDSKRGTAWCIATFSLNALTINTTCFRIMEANGPRVSPFSLTDVHSDIRRALAGKIDVGNLTVNFRALQSNTERVYFARDILKMCDLLPGLVNVEKCDEKSEERRKYGNHVFAKLKRDHDAMRHYNKSVAYAKSRETLALAYANRSAVLFQNKLYKECLIDIENAFNCGYPEHLQQKLIERKEKAEQNLKELNSESQMEDYFTAVPKITNAQSPKFECASDLIEMKYTKMMGRHIVAKENINPGDIIAVEEPFTAILLYEFYLTHCHHCLRLCHNLIPCLKCPLTLYCSDICRNISWDRYHKFECSLLDTLHSIDATKLQLLAMRVVLTARNNVAEIFREGGNIDESFRICAFDSLTVENTKEFESEQLSENEESLKGKESKKSSSGSIEEINVEDSKKEKSSNQENEDLQKFKSATLLKKDSEEDSSDSSQGKKIAEILQKGNSGSLLKTDGEEHSFDNSRRKDLPENLKNYKSASSAQKYVEANLNNANFGLREEKDLIKQPKNHKLNSVEKEKCVEELKKSKSESGGNSEMQQSDFRQEKNLEKYNPSSLQQKNETEDIEENFRGIEKKDTEKDIKKGSFVSVKEKNAEEDLEKHESTQEDLENHKFALLEEKILEEDSGKNKSDSFHEKHVEEELEKYKLQSVEEKIIEKDTNSCKFESEEKYSEEDLKNCKSKSPGEEVIMEDLKSGKSQFPEEKNVKKGIKTEEENIEDTEKYKSASYKEIHNLVTNEEHRPVSDLFSRSVVAAVLMHLLGFTTFFREFDGVDEETVKKYITSLLLRHLQTAPSNMHEVSELQGSVENGYTNVEIGAGAYAFMSLLNHSCSPNVVRHCHGTKMVLRALRPIKIGHQLFDNYGYHHALMGRDERRTCLKDQYWFLCECKACVSDWPLYHKLQENSTELVISEEELNSLTSGSREMARKLMPKLVENAGVFENSGPGFGKYMEMLDNQEIMKQCFALFGNKHTVFKI